MQSLCGLRSLARTLNASLRPSDPGQSEHHPSNSLFFLSGAYSVFEV